MEYKKFYNTELFEFKKFYNLEEIEKYYNEKTNTYSFEENGMILNVLFIFDLKINSNIFANNIIAQDIECLNISASNIEAFNINTISIIANDIDALAVNVSHKIVYSGMLNIRYSINCGTLVYSALTNW